MFLRRLLSFWITISFVSTLIIPPQKLYAQTVLDLPAAGTMVSVSPAFEPALIRGLTVHKDNPFLFDFIVDPGDDKTVIPAKAGIQYQEQLRAQADRMIKYFFAALTIPDKDIWVNLSPYEKDRMVPVSLGQTAMGRDLLAQDYLLKQLTASLIYPQNALGKTFWDKVYTKAKEMYGTTQIPVNTFNKVWIVPQKAGVYEHGQTAFIVSGHLKVMLEQDYLALQKHTNNNSLPLVGRVREGDIKGNTPPPILPHEGGGINSLGSQIIRQIILPEIEKEVNEGKNFATLRQIFYAQVLAVWFKRNLKQALLNRVYANKGTVKGIDQNDAATNEAIYHQYLRAYKKGVFNFIKEESFPPLDGEGKGGVVIARKYFSGGYFTGKGPTISPAKLTPKDEAQIAANDFDFAVLAASPTLTAVQSHNNAMLSGLKKFVWRTPLSLLLLVALATNAIGQTNNTKGLLSWMQNNVYKKGEFGAGLPKSFGIPENMTAAEREKFWSAIGDDSVEGVMERILTGGTNLYDAWLGRITRALTDPDNLKDDILTDTLLYGRFGQLNDIRAWKNPPFRYQGATLSKENASFFRFLSPLYLQPDPKTGQTEKPGFPGSNQIHWEDWMPVTGENAWIIIGALQVAYAKGHGTVDKNSKELKLALSIVPALKALKTDIGAILYAPEGTFGKDKDDISIENNISARAGLRMLHSVTKDPQFFKMVQGINNFLKNHGYNKITHTFYQGGLYKNGQFLPHPEFAEDVQAWAQLELSPATMDEWYGEGEAHYNWVVTKRRAGYFKDGQLIGVGFQNGRVDSIEWSYGAIGAALERYLYYKDSHPEWAKESLDDAISMLKGQEQFKRIAKDGSISYLYASNRIPTGFGWWANPIPSLASTAWAYLIQNGWNPFVLGGKTYWFKIPGLEDVLKAIAQGQVPAPAAPVVRPPAQAPPAPPAVPSARVVPVAPAAPPVQRPEPPAPQPQPRVVQPTTPPAKTPAPLPPSPPPVQTQPQAVNPAADDEKANQLINAFQETDKSGNSNLAIQLKAMGEHALPALIKHLLNKKGNIQSRTWVGFLLSIMATNQTAPWVAWAFEEFQRNASTPEEKEAAQKSLRFFSGNLHKIFDPITPKQPPFITDRAMLNDKQKNNADKAALAIYGGIDLSQQDAALRVEKDANGGVKVNVDPALIARIEREGMPEVVPVIINMRPADVQSLFGVKASIN